MNFGVFDAKKVSPLGERTIAFTPYTLPSLLSPLTSRSLPHALPCRSESQPPLQPQVQGWAKPGGTSNLGGGLHPAGPPRPRDYSSQMPAPGRGSTRTRLFPLPGKHRGLENAIVFLFGFHSLSAPGRGYNHSLPPPGTTGKPCSPQPAPFPAPPLPWTQAFQRAFILQPAAL